MSYKWGSREFLRMNMSSKTVFINSLWYPMHGFNVLFTIPEDSSMMNEPFHPTGAVSWNVTSDHWNPSKKYYPGRIPLFWCLVQETALDWLRLYTNVQINVNVVKSIPRHQGLFILAWIDVYPNMDKWLHTLKCMAWNYLIIPKL